MSGFEVSRTIMVDLSWDHAFADANGNGARVPLEMRRVLDVMQILGTPEGVTALELQAGYAEAAEVSRPTARNAVLRTAGVGLLRVVPDVTDGKKHRYHLSKRAKDGLERLDKTLAQVDRVIAALRFAPDAYPAEADELPDGVYFNVQSKDYRAAVIEAAKAKARRWKDAA